MVNGDYIIVVNDDLPSGKGEQKAIDNDHRNS